MSDPVIWEKYGDFVLTDITLPQQAKVKEFALKHYIEKNTICQLMKFTEEENYIQDHNFFMDHIFNGQCSLVVMNEETDDIVAAIIMKIMTKEMKSWTAIRLVSKNPKMNSLLTLTRQLISETDALLNYPIGSMHVFELCVPQYDDPEKNITNWTPVLFRGAYRVAQSMKMPLVTFTALSLAEQAAVTSLGLPEVCRIFYPTFTEIGGYRPVPQSDVGESNAIFYAQQVEPIVPYYEMP